MKSVKVPPPGPAKQPELSIYSTVDLDNPLFDYRPRTYGSNFGTVRRICKQFGIKIIDHGKYKQFMAPKLRIQMLIEKLHFSKSPYSKGV